MKLCCFHKIPRSKSPIKMFNATWINDWWPSSPSGQGAVWNDWFSPKHNLTFSCLKFKQLQNDHKETQHRGKRCTTTTKRFKMSKNRGNTIKKKCLQLLGTSSTYFSLVFLVLVQNYYINCSLYSACQSHEIRTSGWQRCWQWRMGAVKANKGKKYYSIVSGEKALHVVLNGKVLREAAWKGL